MGCDKIDRSMDVNLSVMTTLELREETSGALESIPAGEYSAVLRLFGQSNVAQILLTVEEKQFAFSLPADKLPPIVKSANHSTRLSSKDLGQPYDVKWVQKHKITDGPLERAGLKYCFEHSFPRIERGIPYTAVYYHYEQIIEESYSMIFLNPNSSNDESLAIVEVSLDRVKLVEDPLPDCL